MSAKQAQRLKRDQENQTQAELDQAIKKLVEEYDETIGARRIKVALARHDKLKVSRVVLLSA
ncbi:hypothetical protein [Thiomicrospira microaerophila]|uniref:hypothetical protein n=1 Tax=Thiomicrospira microaerophila TaxID=406020 RepID=UPI0005C93FC0|nr:hypothetical protein [Thiomicrospira microaerophila]